MSSPSKAKGSREEVNYLALSLSTVVASQEMSCMRCRSEAGVWRRRMGIKGQQVFGGEGKAGAILAFRGFWGPKRSENVSSGEE